VLAHPALAEGIEVGRPKIPGALGLDEEPGDRVEWPSGRVANRVELLGAGESGEQGAR
jgi:hypothetical protein